MNKTDLRQPHPQRFGRTLFLPWCAGLLAQAVLLRIVWMTAAQGDHPQARLFQLAVAVLACSWQAWLLFRPGWRFAIWAALPVVFHLIAPPSVRWLELQFVFGPFVQMACLVGVRQHASAWFLAIIGRFLFVAIGSGIALLFFGNAVAYNPTGARISSTEFHVAVVSGFWLLGEIAAAYVLAFWMPPVVPASKDPLIPPVERNDPRT